MSSPKTPGGLKTEMNDLKNNNNIKDGEGNVQKVNQYKEQEDDDTTTKCGNQTLTDGTNTNGSYNQYPNGETTDNISTNQNIETMISVQGNEINNMKTKDMTFDDDDDDDLKMALALSMQTATASTQVDVYEKNIKSDENDSVNIHAFHKIMWNNSVSDVTGTTQEDQSRWMSQGIILSSFNTINETNNFHNNDLNINSQLRPKWGLVQNHGGPCGVLAAIQAEVLRIILFESDRSKSKTSRDTTDKESMQNLKKIGGNKEDMKDCVALAMSRILVRTAMAPPNENEFVPIESPCVKVVFPVSSIASSIKTNDYKGLDWDTLSPWPWGDCSQAKSTMKCTSHVISLSQPPASNSSQNLSPSDMEEKLIAKTWMFLKDHMQYFHADGGVLLFVMSLVETRGAGTIKNDMDDPQYSHLTSQFGHCSQELINLILTGRATTNVFDHTVDMSGLKIHGISERPSIGYLTQLESLRYCSVGTYYKTPTYPIWVIGSQSHFTVLFSQDLNVVKESESENILERCRRVFRSVDCAEENGFIQVSSLGKVIKGLDMEEKVGGENGINILAETLEVHGAGIILWDDFWRVAGRLLTNASFESVILSEDNTSEGIGSGSSTATLGGSTIENEDVEMVNSTVAMGYNTDLQIENDEEMAKRLATEYGTAPRDLVPGNSPSIAKSDEEYARILQAQFDAEGSNEEAGLGSTSIRNINNNESESKAIVKYEEGNSLNIIQAARNVDNNAGEMKSPHENSTSQSKPQNRSNIEFERFGETFTLHHYNGLRGGILTTFKITKLSAEDVVGASVALSQISSQGADGSQEYSKQNRGSGDLEDIVRTRWPSCLFNWSDSENQERKIGVSLID